MIDLFDEAPIYYEVVGQGSIEISLGTRIGILNRKLQSDFVN